MKKIFYTAALLTLGLLELSTAQAQDTRLLRDPAMSKDKIAFVYAGDIWLANPDGANVKRITAFEGVEADPHFSPDGATIAFTGEYDGNTDVYVVPTAGGEPKRLSWHPAPDFVRGWSPDGSEVIFASGCIRAPYPEADQLWKIPLKGGNPIPLIVPKAGNGKFSPDGKQFVYEEIVPWEQEFRNYRGGQNSLLRIFDFQNNTVIKLPWGNSRDIEPVCMHTNI